MKKHLPNILTSLNLLSGWVALYFTFNEQFLIAVLLIVIASVFDFLDGFVAKILKVQSELGAQLDSFADLVTFGIAPAAITYKISSAQFNFSHDNMNIILFIFIGLIPVFAALRLAKFNTEKPDSSHFVGLPSPAFALIVAASATNYLYYYDWFSTFSNHQFIFPILMIAFGYLMVTKLNFISFKFESFDFSSNKFRYGLFISSIIVTLLLIILGETVLISVFVLLLYIIFSLIYNLRA